MTRLIDHVVLVGHGRVGRVVTEALRNSRIPLLVIDDTEEGVEKAREQGFEVINGNAASPDIIAAANLPAARCLLVAIPNAFEGGQVVQQGRNINPELIIVARAHSEDEIEYLKKHGATKVIMGEHEIAKAMIADVPALAATPTAERRAATAE